MTAGIDWGDHPDWRDRLEASRQPPTPAQSAWDRHWVRFWSAAVRNGTDPTRAVRTAHERTTARYGQRPGDEETAG